MVALLRLPVGKWRDDPEVIALIEKGVAEVAALGHARGVKLPADMPARCGSSSTRRAPPDMLPSMAIDYAATGFELPWLGGKVVALGRDSACRRPRTTWQHAAPEPYAKGTPA